MTTRIVIRVASSFPALSQSPVALGHRRALPAGDAGPFVSFVIFVVRS